MARICAHIRFIHIITTNQRISVPMPCSNSKPKLLGPNTKRIRLFKILSDGTSGALNG